MKRKFLIAFSVIAIVVFASGFSYRFQQDPKPWPVPADAPLSLAVRNS